MGPVYGQFNFLAGIPRKSKKPGELLVLVAVRVRETLIFPCHNRGVDVPERPAVPAPLVAGYRLPRLLPFEGCVGDRAIGRPYIVAECEKRIETLKKFDIPVLAFCDGGLGECRIAIDEYFERNLLIFITPKPGTAGEIYEYVGPGTYGFGFFFTLAEIPAFVIDKYPSIPKPVLGKGSIDVSYAVGRVERDGVLLVIVNTFSCVFQVVNVV